MRQFEIESSFFNANTCYHIRLTDPTLDLDKTFDLFKHYNYLIVSQEHEETNKHQHVLLAHPFADGINAAKAVIREEVRSSYPEIKGNKGLSIKLARDKKSLASYVIKDGSYKYKGFTDNFMKIAVTLSYQTDALKTSYKQIRDKFELREMDLREYSNAILVLKSEHNQPIYVNHHTAHILSCAIKMNNEYATEITEVIMAKLNYFPP